MLVARVLVARVLGARVLGFGVTGAGAPGAGVRRARFIAACVLGGGLLTACGSGETAGGPTTRFEPDGFGITFDYPSALSEKALRPDGSSGNDPGKPDDVVRELTLTDDDFIAVRRDPMDPTLLASPPAALEPEVNQLAKVLDPGVGPGRSVTVGGMPGFEYRDDGSGAQQRFLFFVGPDVLYLVHCKATAAHATEIADACATVEHSLRKA
ncbi:MAG TPA: hypothetical protein VL595_30190 [Pseudonocardia sp.]|nr:hypothetical protein [Pseudonocardia sp.]